MTELFEPVSNVTVVIVIYNSGDVVGEAVAALPRWVEVIVVDNASTDAGAAEALEGRGDVRLVRLPRNLGFGGGCNAGARAATRDVIVFLNPDARVTGEAIRELATAVSARSWTMAYPKMRDDNGRIVPIRRPYRHRRHAAQYLPSGDRWKPSHLEIDVPFGALAYEQGGEVAVVDGACFAVQRCDLAAIGGFDEDLFLYCEEESLAARFRSRGGHVLYVPDVTCHHVGGTSTTKTGHFATFHMFRSRAVLARKMYGPIGGRARIVLVLFGLLVGVPTAALNSLLGRGERRSLTIAWLRAAIRGLVSGGSSRLRSAAIY